MNPELNRIYYGDHLGKDAPKVLTSWSENLFDAVVTDPPYELGFMGKSWDSSGIAYSVEFWKDVLRVMKPGAHLVAFGGTRTYHRMACAIEDAGFEVRDQLQWLYGSGFPKSMDISKAIDKAAGEKPRVVGKRTDGRYKNGFSDKAKRALGGEVYDVTKGFNGEMGLITEPTTEAAKLWAGWGTALKPANEPIILARKPCSEKTVAANVLKWGTGALNIDDSRIPGSDGGDRIGEESRERRYNEKGGTDFAMKPGPRGGDAKGRWPANLVIMHHTLCVALECAHACVPDCPMRIMDDQSGRLQSGQPMGVKAGGQGNAYGRFAGGIPVTGYGDAGGASRFFYCAKPDGVERDIGLESEPKKASGVKNASGRGYSETDPYREVRRGNIHPTVKPIDLMRYLIQLTTPKGGVCLDPFMGSGTTAIAAARLGHPWLGIDKDASYIEIAQKRILGDSNGRLL